MRRGPDTRSTSTRTCGLRCGFWSGRPSSGRSFAATAGVGIVTRHDLLTWLVAEPARMSST